MTFVNYITEINKQRELYPKYKKQHYFNNLPNYTFNFEEIFDEIKIYNKKQLVFVSIIELENPLYPEIDDLLYAEFVDFSRNTNSSLNRWKFYYVPVSYFDLEVEQGITFKEKFLPYMYNYNVKTKSVKRIYPLDPFLFRFKPPETYSLVNPLPTNLHPLANNFVFTGKYFLTNNSGQFIFEYNDYKGFRDYFGIKYYSSIKPIDFHIYTSNINAASIQQINPALNENSIPEEYTWAPGETYNLFFTGNKTTKSFSTKTTWFTYLLTNEDGLDFEVLINSMPINTSIDFVKKELGASPTINIFPKSNSQSITYNQKSNPIVLNINNNLQ